MLQVVISEVVVDEVKILASLLTDVTRYLHQKRLKQWLEPWDENQLVNEIKNHQVFIIRMKNEIRATFSLSREGFPWESHPGISVNDVPYFYRFAVDTDLIGTGIGSKILPEIEHFIKNKLGIEQIRLDCWAGNNKLKDFYLNNGYSCLGDIPEKDYKISLFVKKI
ncbi:MAG: GNAT family N-acetyltransferase [Spirochaetales bacterium]|nr:GNAT family N-acetyltransferase [Spirochaetales bacterium]